MNYFQGYAMLHDLGIDFSCGLLLSYFYYSEKDLTDLFNYYCQTFNLTQPRLFVDSGAYTAMTSGVQIDIKEYAAWVHRFKELVSVVSNLDVIKEPEKTLDNQHQMEDLLDIPVMPCFHVLETFDFLQNYLDNYNHIGLGFAGMTRRKKGVADFLSKCFIMSKDKPVYHGFAMTTNDMIQTFHFKSVDSSSWSSSHRYGSLILYDRKKSKMIDYTTPTTSGHRDVDRFPILYRDYEPFYNLIFDKDSYYDKTTYLKRYICSGLSIRSFDLLTAQIRDKFQDPDFTIYLSDTTA